MTNSLSNFRSILTTLRKPKYFLLIIFPLGLVVGTFLPEFSRSLNDLGYTLIQLISYPAIPLVLTAVIISVYSILSLDKSNKNDSFARKLVFSLIIFTFVSSFLALALALYQKPGILSPDGKVSIGKFMLDITDINLTVFSSNNLDTVASNSSWLQSIIPSNILSDAASSNTLKVISGSLIAGYGLSILPKDVSSPLVSLLRSVNSLSVKVLDELLLLSPILLICLIAGAITSINTEIIIALLNVTICILVSAVACLGISRLIIKRYTSKEEKALLETNPADSVFIVGLSTGSSMACYPTITNTLKLIGRASSQVEASTSLSLLISRLGNVVYNVIAIVFALNLYEVRLSPIVLIQVIILGVVSGISSAGLNGVAVVPTIAIALIFFQVPAPPILLLLLAIDPIMTLPRAAISGVMALCISVISSNERNIKAQ
tara:strand:- start:760 stop:2058 length:1299 start_codon:yes stop_codon:yes gene_type:complete